MAEERFLVTGALGCIGAWTVKRLVDQGVPVWTYDLPGDPHRLRLVMSDEDIARVTFLEGDITDQTRFESVVVDQGITHVVHYAALQVPFVRANPVLGMAVNVVGTTIVFETVKRHQEQVKGLVYTSSTGVYGPPHLYPPGPLAHDAPLLPPTLYGVSKQANEWTARTYWQDYAVHSVGIRPFFVYGPGRDQGISSVPTKAMLAAAVGRPYRISMATTAVYQHADDVAGIALQAARSSIDGAPVFNLGGHSAPMSEVVAAIEAAVPAAAGTITFDPQLFPIPEDVDGGPLAKALGGVHYRPFADGVRETIEHFRQAAAAGRLDVERAIA
jgi:nucleoside-diphosphate-sugar epimerase